MRLRVLILALLAAGVLIPTALVLTQQRASAATMVLTIFDGTADVSRGAGAFARVADGHILSPGDRVRTADQSHAIVTFFDGSTVEIEPATTVTVVQAAADASGAITIQLEQAIGRTWSSIQKLARSDSKFELRTPSATAIVRGTGFVTDVLATGATTVTTTEGMVEVSAQGTTVAVPGGSSTTVQPNTPPTPPVPGPRPQNLLRFALHSPAHLVVLDAFGRACGVIPAGPTVVRQIPGCLATEAGVDPQLVDLPDAQAGMYSLVIEMTAPGGDFIASASAADGAGALSFNYTVSGGGPQGTKFGSGLVVERAVGGALRAGGLSKLALLDRAPTHVVVMAGAKRPSASGSPDTAVFALLSRFGFAAGVEVTPSPSTQTAPPAAATPSPPPSPTPTEMVATQPTPEPTIVPVRTPAPTPRPPTPAPETPSPTQQPTPSPTPSPAPTAGGPTLIGGFGSPGNPMNVTGRGWSTAVVTLSWEDGRPLVQVKADAAGDFTASLPVPFDANVGTTYRISASDGRLTATAQVGIYTPTITVTCTSATVPVSVVGGGWPPASRYALRSSLLSTAVSGTVGADGAFGASFAAPPGTSPGDYLISANVGSLLAEAQTCTLR